MAGRQHVREDAIARLLLRVPVVAELVEHIELSRESGIAGRVEQSAAKVVQPAIAQPQIAHDRRVRYPRGVSSSNTDASPGGHHVSIPHRPADSFLAGRISL